MGMGGAAVPVLEGHIQEKSEGAVRPPWVPGSAVDLMGWWFRLAQARRGHVPARGHLQGWGETPGTPGRGAAELRGEAETRGQ